MENSNNKNKQYSIKTPFNIIALDYIFALILILYPLRHAFVGIDIMDSGYSLGNYRFFDVLNISWKLATYLSNIVGILLSKLPFGNTWAGMNIYSGLLVGFTASYIYIFIVKQFQLTQYSRKILIFIAEFVALSLCWAPYTILYQYLGYLLMSIAVLVLYSAITTDNTIKYVIAGIILGLCIAVRMPNITYMAFILPVWYYCFLKRDKFITLIKRTGYCILGYITGVIIPFGIICARYGLNAYPSMVKDLFTMTDTATDYKPTSMITSIFEDYTKYSIWLLLFLAYSFIGIIFFYLFEKIEKGNKFTFIKIFENLCKAGFVIGFFVLLRFCYGYGMFDFNYTDYLSMYKWLIVFLLIVIFFCIFLLLSKLESPKNKLWAIFMLVIIFITPLGSNNRLYPIINNLFIIAPVFLYLLLDIISKMHFGKNTGFVCKTVLYGVLICSAFQSVLFGVIFVFHDNLTSAEYSLELPIDSPANGMKTNVYAKEELEHLAEYLSNYGLLDRKLILYGDIPALSYILDMEPAIFTTWVDLDSNSAMRLKEELDTITTQKNELLPVVILGENITYQKLFFTSDNYITKPNIINNFMQDNSYTKVYDGVSYRVYIPQ